MLEFLGYLNIVLVFAVSFFIASRFFKSVLDAIVLAYMIVWADLILTALFLSAFQKLNAYTAYFVVSLLILIFVLAFLKVTKVTTYNFVHDSDFSRLNFTCYLILSIIAIIFFLNLITVFAYPPNNYDSLTYHLPRIHLYFSQGHLGHFFAHNERLVFFPFNATLFQLPIVEYGLPDRLFSFINLISWGVVGITAYRLSFFIVQSSYAGLVSAFFALMGTAVLAQATTTNSDILLAAPLLLSIYFIFLWSKYRYNSLLLFSFLAAGIALGTKVTVAYFLPGFVLFFLYVSLRKKLRPDFSEYFRKINWKVVIVAVLLASMLALPSYYINYRDSRHFSAPRLIVYVNTSDYLKTAGQNFSGMTTQFFLNPIALLSYDFFSVYDYLNGTIYKHAVAFHINHFLNKFWLKEKWDRNLSKGSDEFYNNFVSKNLVEDEVWYGAGGYLVILSLVIVFFRRKNLSKEFPYCIFIIFLCAFYFLTYGALMKWQPWSSRFFIPGYALMSPLIGIAFNSLDKYRNHVRAVILLCIVIVSFESLSYIFLNQRRPLNSLDVPFSYSPNADFSELSKYNNICIVGSSYDQSIYPLMREGKRQNFILSDKPLPGYYNVFSVPKRYAEKSSSTENTQYLGEYDGFWYGLNLDGEKALLQSDVGISK